MWKGAIYVNNKKNVQFCAGHWVKVLHSLPALTTMLTSNVAVCLKEPKGMAAMLKVDKVSQDGSFFCIVIKQEEFFAFPIPDRWLYSSSPCPSTFISDTRGALPFQDLTTHPFSTTLWHFSFYLASYPPYSVLKMPCFSQALWSQKGQTGDLVLRDTHCTHSKSESLLSRESIRLAHKDIFHTTLFCYYKIVVVGFWWGFLCTCIVTLEHLRITDINCTSSQLGGWGNLHVF